MHIPTGLVPLFRPAALRPLRPEPTRAKDHEPSYPVAPGMTEASANAKTKDAGHPESDAAPDRKPAGAHWESDEEMRRGRRRFFQGVGAERLALHRTLSEALGLPALCRNAACRRAARCANPKGAFCLADNGELVRSALGALKEAALSTPQDEAETPSLGAAPTAPRARRAPRKP